MPALAPQFGNSGSGVTVMDGVDDVEGGINDGDDDTLACAVSVVEGGAVGDAEKLVDHDCDNDSDGDTEGVDEYVEPVQYPKNNWQWFSGLQCSGVDPQ